MPSNELERLTSDLSTIRNAMRLDKPYAWDDVLMELLTALGGLLAILLIVFTPLDNRVAFMLGVAPAIIYYYRFSVQRRRDQADRPGLWQEVKVTLQATAIVLPLVIGWLIWSRVTESIDRPSAGAAVLFFVGVGLAYVGVFDSNRRKYLAGSVALMAYGLIYPFLTPHQGALCGASALIVGGLGGAAIIRWQLKRDRTSLMGTEAIQ